MTDDELGPLMSCGCGRREGQPHTGDCTSGLEQDAADLGATWPLAPDDSNRVLAYQMELECAECGHHPGAVADCECCHRAQRLVSYLAM